MGTVSYPMSSHGVPRHQEVASVPVPPVPAPPGLKLELPTEPGRNPEVGGGETWTFKGDVNRETK